MITNGWIKRVAVNYWSRKSVVLQNQLTEYLFWKWRCLRFLASPEVPLVPLVGFALNRDLSRGTRLSPFFPALLPLTSNFLNFKAQISNGTHSCKLRVYCILQSNLILYVLDTVTFCKCVFTSIVPTGKVWGVVRYKSIGGMWVCTFVVWLLSGTLCLSCLTHTQGCERTEYKNIVLLSLLACT